MAFENRIKLKGSERRALPGSTPVGAVDPNETVRVTVFLRPKGAAPAVPGTGTPRRLSHEEFAQRHGADPADIALVEKFAHAYQLTIVESSARKRRVILTGTAQLVSQAFGAELVCYRVESTGHNFRGRTDSLTIPAELEGVVVAVLGLDTRPIAKPHIRRSPRLLPHQVATATYTPPQVAALYNFPGNVNGSGQTIAIIELGGGYSTTDLQTYFSGLGINEPSVTAVSVDGGQNSPGSQADAEVMLDIEVAGSIANGANIAVYFAPNTDQGFIDAITDAVHDTTRNPSVVSISWGGPEDSWTQQSQTAMNSALQDAATLGVTVTIAAGDNGSSDGELDGNLHVDFPASSPFALACGGTTLVGSGTSISSEVVWNETANNEGATGGGVSNVFALPSYQSSAGVPAQPQTSFVGRGVPDVAGDADPTTGYQVLVDGQNEVVGGTSAVAPLWAALVALLNQQLGSNVGFLNPKLYPLGESVFNDITSGNNDDSGLGYYSAQTGWDPCSGLGSPNGTEILNALSSSSTSSSERVVISGSAPQHNPADTMSEIPDPEQQEVTATLIIQRSQQSDAASQIGQDLLSGKAPHLSLKQAEEATTADPKDVAAVCAFAREYGLTILEENPQTRTVRVQGSAQQMDQAFAIDLCWVTDTKGNRYLTYMGPISIPKSLSGVVTAVLGLDQRPVAKHHAAR
ncbi:MAG: S8 family serine peptidase [Acidobacteriaceae bacterium]|nr:S8 family serine peptidase [Acidobacteriaceae bacterium]